MQMSKTKTNDVVAINARIDGYSREESKLPSLRLYRLLARGANGREVVIGTYVRGFEALARARAGYRIVLDWKGESRQVWPAVPQAVAA